MKYGACRGYLCKCEAYEYMRTSHNYDLCVCQHSHNVHKWPEEKSNK